LLALVSSSEMTCGFLSDIAHRAQCKNVVRLAHCLEPLPVRRYPVVLLRRSAAYCSIVVRNTICFIALHRKTSRGAYEKTTNDHCFKNPAGGESVSGLWHRRSRRTLAGCAMVGCVRRSRSLKPIGRAPYHEASFRVSCHASCGFIIHRTTGGGPGGRCPPAARCRLSLAHGRDLHPQWLRSHPCFARVMENT